MPLALWRERKRSFRMNRITDFEGLIKRADELAAGRPRVRVVLSGAEDESGILALEAARIKGQVDPILVGDAEEIAGIMGRLSIDAAAYRIYDIKDPVSKADKAVELVRSGEADALMKGLIPTSTFLHPIFRHGTGLRAGKFISHVGLLQVEGMDRLILQTDGGINVNPDIEMKKGIIVNAVFLAHMLGVERPRVAILSASEKVHPKIPSTVEARDLAIWAKEAVPDADVDGPLALDIAISHDAAVRKGVHGNVAGYADILVAGNIEVGNVIYKAARYFGHAKGAGIVVGAACPVLLASRSDPMEEKLNSIALAILYAAHMQEARNRLKDKR